MLCTSDRGKFNTPGIGIHASFRCRSMGPTGCPSLFDRIHCLKDASVWSRFAGWVKSAVDAAEVRPSRVCIEKRDGGDGGGIHVGPERRKRGGGGGGGGGGERADGKGRETLIGMEYKRNCGTHIWTETDKGGGGGGQGSRAGGLRDRSYMRSWAIADKEEIPPGPARGGGGARGKQEPRHRAASYMASKRVGERLTAHGHFRWLQAALLQLFAAQCLATAHHLPPSRLKC